MKNVRLALMLLREALSKPRLQRQPEPTAEMDDPRNVQAFHDQGSPTGPLLPVYHFNALATSALLSAGGTLVDLGSGSAQYLAYLAQRRPDIRIVGIDLSTIMVSIGRKFLAEVGLDDRVDLLEGDMTSFLSRVPQRVDAVSSIFSLHHLPDVKALTRCIDVIARVRDEHGSAVWIFDHARPRHPRTPEIFPELFTPDAPKAFRNDSRNSLVASFSYEELVALLDGSAIGCMAHHRARFMPLYQAHHVQPAGSKTRKNGHHLWRSEPLPSSACKEFAGLRMLFPGVLVE